MSLGISYGLSAQTQNGVWSLTPNYSKVTTNNVLPPVPLPTANDYAGDEATNVSNAMQDADGNLLFFIVDGRL